MSYMKDLDIRIRSGGDDAVAAACELMPKWIPVSERLPVIKDRVLVRVDGWTTIAYRINASSVYNAWVGPDGHGLLPPTHWMPLPEPPEVTPSVADVISHAEPKGQGHASGQIPGCLVDHDQYRHEPPEVK
jgi:hypothetical protein